jgi:hypothetical protein
MTSKEYFIEKLGEDSEDFKILERLVEESD